MIDFCTKQLVIVAYPPAAGGKFLINCLGLSDQAVLQHAGLAQQQLDKQIDLAGKLHYLVTQINDSIDQGRWTDLGLGCQELFGITNSQYIEHSSDAIKASKQWFHPIVKQLSTGNLKFFLVAHGTRYLSAYQEVWPNAIIILFENYRNFLQTRKFHDPQLQRFWEGIRQPHWPVVAPQSWDKIKQLDSEMYSAVIKQHASIDNYFINGSFKSATFESFDNAVNNIKLQLPEDQYFIWNTDWYNTQQDCIVNIDNCCNWLDIPTVNSGVMIEYYNAWKKSLDYFSKI
jgi:hypothetical protein